MSDETASLVTSISLDGVHCAVRSCCDSAKTMSMLLCDGVADLLQVARITNVCKYCPRSECAESAVARRLPAEAKRGTVVDLNEDSKATPGISGQQVVYDKVDAVSPVLAGLPSVETLHGNARRRYTTDAGRTTALMQVRGNASASSRASSLPPRPDALVWSARRQLSTACAIVPLYPNELTPPVVAV